MFTGLEWPKNELTNPLPTPEFSVSPKSINESQYSVSGTWEGVEDQEVVDYLEKLKAAGYTVNASENKDTNSYLYSADNSEDHQTKSHVMLQYMGASDSNKSMLSILVG